LVASTIFVIQNLIHRILAKLLKKPVAIGGG